MTWFLNRLSFVLLVSGFCANMTITNNVIAQKQVLVNGVVMADTDYQVQPGDFITLLKPLQSTQPTYSAHLAPNCLQMN
jgi:ribosomal protein S4